MENEINERLKRIESTVDYIMDNIDILVKAHIDTLKTSIAKDKRIDEIQILINEYRREYENR